LAISVRSAAGIPPAVIRDVLVEGFDVGAFVDCGVEDGARVVEGGVFSAVEDVFEVGVLGTESVVDVLGGTEV
jgi:hypothetical protein